MKFVIRIFQLFALSLVMIPVTILAQDETLSGPYGLMEATPLDTTNGVVIEAAGESFTASDGASESYVNLDWTIYQQCLFGKRLSIKLYRDNVEIYSYDYYPTTFGNGWSHGYTDYVGPGKSHTYKLDRFSSDGFLCNVHWTPTDPGSTTPIHKPENFFASEDTTVGYVRLGWTSATRYGTQFKIYRDDQDFATVPVSQKYFIDYNALPGQRYKYVVKTYNHYSGLYSAPSVEKFGRAVFFRASDGVYDDEVQLDWTLFPVSFENELRIYRDGERLSGVVSGQTYKPDKNIIPGKIHEYKLEAVHNNQIRLTILDHGFAPADGYVKGSVTTPTGTGGVSNVEMRAYPSSGQLSYSLSLDGSNDYVLLPPVHLNTNTFTISAWIKRDGAQDDFDGLLFSRSSATAGLHIMNNGELRYNWDNLGSSYNWSSGLFVPADKWSFVALVVEPGKATLFVDDTSAANTLSHAQINLDNPWEIGRDRGQSNRYFSGMIDEVCMWKTACSEEEIITERHRIRSGSELDLVAYWRFNLGSGTIAGDFAENGDHHGTLMGDLQWVSDSPRMWHFGLTKTNGSYTIPRINWEENVDFTIKPYKAGHGFKGSNFPGDSLILPFSEFDHEYQGINFLDTTSIEISGWVYLNYDSQCPLPGAAILVDAEQTGVYTDSSGFYSISVPSAGKYTISAEYLNHAIIPQDTLLDLQDPVDDLVFWDTTMTTVNGKVAGGCDNFIGMADIHIKSLVSTCIDTVLKTDESGMYEITLPAQHYSAQLLEIDHPDRLTIINYFTADTINLSLTDTTHNFIYHSPPMITISELPEEGCSPFDVPILLQDRTYVMRIDVTEKYGDLECNVNEGTLIIYDGIAYDNPESSYGIGDSILYYPLIPGYPNLTANPVRPHQKSLVVKASVNKYTVFDTLWVFVRGQKPREFQFSTVSPEIPLMILHDPPGDQSYSYLSKTTTSSVNIGFSFESEVGVGIFTKFKVGGGGDIPGIGSTGAWLGGEAEANVGVRNSMEGNQEIVISTTEMLKTSDSENIVGEQGDVYMGAALNIIYAKTDILEYDTENCTAVRDTGIVWNGDGFKTTYLYTESHIRESVIPGLQTLADILNSSSEKIKQDSAEVFLNQKDVWQQVLDYNAALKQSAQPLPQFPGNISFSAGTHISEESTISSTSTLSIGLNLFIDASLALSIGAKAGDFNEAESGVKIFAKLDIGISGGVSYEISNTIGFELGDNDDDPPGDAFTVDIKGDPVYGTPLFDLLSGTSSCPWEPGTLPREGVELAINTPSLSNIPPEQPANFDLYLTNTSQNDETRTYLLSLIQGSNPDGAIISVGGAVLGDDELSFTMPPNRDDPQRASLRVARAAGSPYDYENLQVHLYSSCDANIDTTISFSVHFIKPCSDVTIIRPERNWIVNSSNNQMMEIVLKDYDAGNPLMSELKFEYRAQDTNDWIELFSYPRATLPVDSILYSWDMSSLTEGIYELRASTYCTLGTYYSRAHSGIFDYTAPVAFGNPQPSDGSYDDGDDIKIEFSENISCLTANSENITMYNLDKNSYIEIEIICKGDELVINPANEEDMIEGDSIRVTIQALSDPFGNVITEPISWEFVVNIITLLPEDIEPKIPTEFVLNQNYPNPFNPETTIRFGIPKAADVELIIYNIKGQVIMRPVSENLAAGFYNVKVDGRNLSTGVYFYRLKSHNFIQTKKFILLK